MRVTQNSIGFKPVHLFDLINIDDCSATPKHMQLVNGFLKSIETGFIKGNDVVPSLNELKDNYEISRDTAEKCYKHLRHMGVLESFPGKGYYVKNMAYQCPNKVFLLFNKLSAHKQIIYNSFVEILGDQASIDFHVYNNDLSVFKKLLTNLKNCYSHYVIIPHFDEDSREVHDLINAIPKHKLVLLGRRLSSIQGSYTAIFENFEEDIYNALEQTLLSLKKYHTISLVFPDNNSYPREIINGVKKFSLDFGFNCKVIHDLKNDKPQEGEVYITLLEDDLVDLIENILSLNLQVGKQVGLISYNETPLKKLVLDGITTISSDFRMMGALAAQMIVEKRREKLSVPFYVKLRSSL